MSCQICPRPAKPNSPLCRFHHFALKRLVARFQRWQMAVKVGWAEYLEKVSANPLSGVWVREVIAWSGVSRKSEDELRGIVGKVTPVLQDP